MKALIKPIFITSAIAAALLSSSANAVDVTFKASVKVQNLFEVTNGNPLNFGTIRAQSHDSDIATYVMLAKPDAELQDPTNPDGTAAISVIEPGSPATFEVTNAAPNQELTITNPTNLDIKGTSGPGFTLSDFTYYVSSGGTTGPVANKIKVDNLGNASFSMGATISTVASTNSYEDGDFSADLQITLEY
ncbi:DUF4402 domain-containing protein [Pseudoalteromonas sp. T1lg65]|uniref:DUF4402 domain-containing protein n=1 Tax=Pseudoalteromonas sp. T1lg65 TaxID=2077101 RepID=UPI003F7933DE